MNVLSLFDGIGCAQLALRRIGIKPELYFASETDPAAIRISMQHFPRTIQLGDVRSITSRILPRIDLLIGGSPCQGFSRAGKELNFQDPRSSLFFEYVRLLKELNPKYFLLENVKMRNEYQDIISGFLGVQPIMIDSNLVSAQNRKRLYWTNIGDIEQPRDRGIMLGDIVQANVDDYFYIARDRWGAIIETYIVQNTTCVAITERRTAEARRIRKKMRLEHGIDHTPHRAKEPVARRDGKMNTLTATFNMKEHTLIDAGGRYRKLTPVEFEALQTIPPQYTGIASNSKRYKLIGNAFTVDVIAHILNHI